MSPLIGVLCCNEVAERPIQAVATRFIQPLAEISGATVVLIPAVPGACDPAALARRLDGLLLTGSRSNVAGHRYAGPEIAGDRLDEARDEVAIALAGRMIDAGRPVFGICRGLQELNVLFGGTLSRGLTAHHHADDGLPYESLFEHVHDVELRPGGLLAGLTGARRIRVNSVHHQGIDRLGRGLEPEAHAAEDGLVEAFSARPVGAPVLAVQWHPEWDAARRPESRAFFRYVGEALAA
ncbi:gamma-glutamyl-gamma-aminobutyrate hydrolase family protein [Sphingomonas sp. KR3-1]|uniref:gamma-glutamyl-gamma-aminobutyrate hydrolase family protein n=1 Tax=Sphingomonas sp. KR3-1 TaxID=3156611 RepID=UPI0032B3E5E1